MTESPVANARPSGVAAAKVGPRTSMRLRAAVAGERLAVLDGLRGTAILLVIWYHLGLVSGLRLPFVGPLQMVADNGFLGVDLFFFLSGFCISYPYARARAAGTPLPTRRTFASRRLGKIVPSYVLAVVVFAIAYHARFAGVGDELLHVVAHLSFVHVFFQSTYGSLSGPLWTLGIEVQFYVLFAIVAPWLARRPVVAYAAFVAIAVGYRGALGAFGLDADFVWLNQLPSVLDLFGAGMLAAFGYVRLRERGGVPTGVATASAFVALGAIVIVLATFARAQIVGEDAVYRWLNASRIAFGPTLALLTLGVAFGSERIRRPMAARVLAFASVVSYNAYLWNLEIAVALHGAGASPAVVFGVGALLTVAVAAALTYGFERPVMRYLTGGSARRGSAPARREFGTVRVSGHA